MIARRAPRFAAIAIGFALAAVRPATAAAAAPYHPFSVSIDIFGPGGASDESEKDFSDAVTALHQQGVGAARTIETHYGVGARGDFFFPPRNGWKVGLGAGYARGPKFKQVLNYSAVPSIGLTAGGYTQETDLSFYRFLGETEVAIPVAQGVNLKLGGGAGIAFCTVRQDGSLAGGIAALATTAAKTEHWNGVTWEVSPSLIFTSSPALDIEVGIRYAQFPTKNGSDDIARIKFSPLSAFLAFRFGS